MRVEAVSHSGDHNAGDEDHHAKGDGAAVAGELGPARGCGQLHFIDQGDVHLGGCGTFGVVGLLWGRWRSHGVLISFFWHCRN